MLFTLEVHLVYKANLSGYHANKIVLLLELVESDGSFGNSSIFADLSATEY